MSRRLPSACWNGCARPVGNTWAWKAKTTADWMLVDFVDVVVHIMRAQTRERYDLESLWDETLGELLSRGDAGLEQAADL